MDPLVGSDFDRSGGFQVMSLAELRKLTEEVRFRTTRTAAT